MELEDSFEDPKDYEIKPSDNILIAGKIEQEFSGLEIYIYEDQTQNLIIHSDIILNSFPICLEWLAADFTQIEDNVAKRGNLAIVGLMTPIIEIWDLDLADPVEPLFSLGGDLGHSDSVTGLDLHKSRVNLLVSSSVDKSVKVWDVQTGKALVTNVDFGDKIQNVFWGAGEESLISGLSGDGVLNFFDIRSNEKNKKFTLLSSIENYCQNPNKPEIFYLTSEKGELMVFDLKAGKINKDSIMKVHEDSATSVVCSVNNHVITNSLDSKIKIFDGDTLKLVKEYDTKAGHLFGSDLHPENPYLFSCGSSIGEVVIWDFNKN